LLITLIIANIAHKLTKRRSQHCTKFFRHTSVETVTVNVIALSRPVVMVVVVVMIVVIMVVVVDTVVVVAVEVEVVVVVVLDTVVVVAVVDCSHSIS